jgi:predicted TIM-barrel fold metal-dependent hydrolase
MIFATDFSHELAYEGYIKEAAEFAERSNLSDPLKKKILADNSLRLYNLNS